MVPSAQHMNIQLEACVDSLSVLAQFMSQGRESLHIPERCYRALELAADEAVTNVIQHGCLREPNSCIKLSLSRHDEWVTLVIEDEGTPFDAPCPAPCPDPDQPLEDRKTGGLGLFLIERMVDEVERLRDGQINRLVLKKKVC